MQTVCSSGAPIRRSVLLDFKNERHRACIYSSAIAGYYANKVVLKSIKEVSDTKRV
jgi:hypothetical protein